MGFTASLAIPEIRGEETWGDQGSYENYRLSKASKIYIKNENPLGPSPAVKKELSRWANQTACWKYDLCDFSLDRLTQKLADLEKLSPSQIFLASGSRAIIFYLLGKLRSNGFHQLVMPFPDFVMVQRYGEMLGYEVRRVPFTDQNFRLPIESLSRFDNAGTVIYFSNPHLPYGTMIGLDALSAFLRGLKKATVVVDEAYIEYLSEEFRLHSSKNLLSQFPNLLVVRTFSKIYGLAGMRVGYCMASSETASRLFPGSVYLQAVNPVAAACAYLSLNEREHSESTRKLVKQSAIALRNHAKNRTDVSVRTTDNIFYTFRIPYTKKNSPLRSKLIALFEKHGIFYWAMDSLREYQTYVSIQDETKTLKTFDDLVKITREIGFL